MARPRRDAASIKILARIASSPGIPIRAICARFPGVPPLRILHMLVELRADRQIEHAGTARYRLAQRRPQSLATARTQIAPMDWLMAGR